MAIIELNYPFNKDWGRGYLRQSKDGRRVVDLFNSKRIELQSLWLGI